MFHEAYADDYWTLQWGSNEAETFQLRKTPLDRDGNSNNTQTPWSATSPCCAGTRPTQPDACHTCMLFLHTVLAMQSASLSHEPVPCSHVKRLAHVVAHACGHCPPEILRTGPGAGGTPPRSMALPWRSPRPFAWAATSVKCGWMKTGSCPWDLTASQSQVCWPVRSRCPLPRLSSIPPLPACR